jgi:hypothetical protein
MVNNGMEFTMSNYPDNFNGSACDRSVRAPEDVFPHETRRVQAAQAVYVEVLTALANGCRREGIMLNAADLAGAMENVAEKLWEDLDEEVAVLKQAGFDITPYPENRSKLHADAAESIFAEWRLKPVPSLATILFGGGHAER